MTTRRGDIADLDAVPQARRSLAILVLITPSAFRVPASPSICASAATCCRGRLSCGQAALRKISVAVTNSCYFKTPLDIMRVIRTVVMLSQSSTNFGESLSQRDSSTMPKIFDKLPLRIIPLGESLV